MQTINLAEPWSYRTPLVTIDFPAGSHEVDDAVAQAAAAAGVIEAEAPKRGKAKDKSDGDEGTATAGAAGDPGAIEGE